MRLSKKKIELAMARSKSCITYLANSSGLTRQVIYKAMNGKDIVPLTAGKLAEALNVDVLEILADEEKEV